MWKNQSPTVEMLAWFVLFHHKDLNDHDDVDEQCQQKSSSPKEFKEFWIIKAAFFAQEEKS